MELTGAYCTFANGGIRPEPYGIRRIEDKNGKVLEENSPAIHRRAFRPDRVSHGGPA